MEINQQANKDISLKGVQSFQQTNLTHFLIQCLKKCSFVRPTPIQYHSIKSFNEYQNHNIIGQSKSGTGKTLSFLVPVLNSIYLGKKFDRQTICIIILPTRQLAIQVHQFLKKIITTSHQVQPLPAQKQFKNALKTLTSLLAIGGIPIEDDKKTLLVSGANFVIGTVGRIYQLLESHALEVDHLKFSIFDQGDKIFASNDQKLNKILQKVGEALKRTRTENQDRATPEDCSMVKKNLESSFRFLVYSATYSQDSVDKITQALSKTLNRQNPQKVKFLFIQTLNSTSTNQFIEKITQDKNQFNSNQCLTSFQAITSTLGKKDISHYQKDLLNLNNIKKFYLQIQSNHKSTVITQKCTTLISILSELRFKKCLIFVEKKALLQQIYDQIKQFEPLLIHGSLSQASRIKIMNQVNKYKIIMSSDLLARGIDLVLDLVILFDAHINQTFWHRIGRTGRFGRIGIVISFDKIENWSLYNPIQINNILAEVPIEEITLKNNEWYGTYMTEQGRWEQINAEKEKIINKNYNFYDQNIDEMKLNKKMKKQIKRIEKSCRQENVDNKLQSKTLSDSGSPQFSHFLLSDHPISTQTDFINCFSKILKCKQCFQMVNQVQCLTGYKFKLKKLFEDAHNILQTKQTKKTCFSSLARNQTSFFSKFSAI